MQLIKMTFTGGFLVLLPVLLLYMLVSEAMGLIIALATPIADAIGIGEIQYPELLAILLLLGASFAIGMLLHMPGARRAGEAVETRWLSRMPAWTFLRSVSRALVQVDERGIFRPGLLQSSGGESELCYVVEDGGDLLTVLLPWAPATFAGTIKIVPSDRVKPVPAGLGKVTQVLANLGTGAQSLMEKDPTTGGDDAGSAT